MIGNATRVGERVGAEGRDVDVMLTLGVPLDRVASVRIGFTGPDNRDHPHGKTNRPNTIIDIPIRRPHSRRADPRNLLNNLPRPPKLRHDLGIGHLRQTEQPDPAMRPRMDAQLVPGLVFIPDDFRPIEHPTPDQEKRRLEALALEVRQQFRGIQSGSVVVPVPVLHRVFTRRDVDVADTLSTRPPASSIGPGLGERFGVGRVLAVRSVSCGGVVWYRRPVDFCHPCLHFW
jgi:hypothetical protein